MIWLIFVAVVVLFIVGALLARRPSADENISTDALVRLYTIRRRFAVSQFKQEVRRDAAHAERQLRKELKRHL